MAIQLWKRALIISDYKTGLYSNIELAGKHKVTNSSVRNILIKEGIYKNTRKNKPTP